MVEQIPTKEFLFVLLIIEANARTGKRIEGCDDGRVLGAYGRDDLNDNGKRLLTLASDNKLVITNTFFNTRKGMISHTLNGVNSRYDRRRIDYILTRQAHRPRVYDVKVHPQPPLPTKADSDHYIVYTMVRLVLHPTDTYEQMTKSSLSTGRSFDLTETVGSEYLRGSFPSFLICPCSPTASLRKTNPSLKLFLML